MAYVRGGSKIEAAFNPNRMNGIINAINRMAGDQRKLHQQSFSTDDLAQLFVLQDYRQLLKDAYAIAAPRGYVFDFYVKCTVHPDMEADRMLLRFTWDGAKHKYAFFPPKETGSNDSHAAFDIMPDCPSELKERFERTVRGIADVSYRWGMVRHVATKLNKATKTPAQMRYIWPCLVPILRVAGYHDIAGEVTEASPRAGEKASVPTDLMPYIKQTNDTVARSLMIDKDQIAAAGKVAVQYMVYPANFHGGKFDGTN